MRAARRLDAAHYYLEEAQREGAADVAERATSRLAEIGRLDAAIDAAGDDVVGEDEGGAATLAAAADALARGDNDTAWRYYSHAYDGLRLSHQHVARAAVGMAWCYLNAGDVDTAAGYLDVADHRDDGSAGDEIRAARARLAELAGGDQALADGVQRDDFNELNAAAVAATLGHDYDRGYLFFQQMYDSDQIAGSERGRIAYNLGLVSLWRRDYPTATAHFEEAQRTASSRIGDRAAELLATLSELDQADELAARTRAEEPLAEPGE